MSRAVCMLRNDLVYRRNAVCDGLKAAGFDVVDHFDSSNEHDVLVIWNRYGGWHEIAQAYERRGSRVIVMENGYLGKKWIGDEWFAMSVGHHSGLGTWGIGGPERWDSLGVKLADWCPDADTPRPLILAQRGIGESGIASPVGWAESVQHRIGGRIRPHPGKHAPAVPIEVDLEGVSEVVTWHSAAALQSLCLGVPVWYDCFGWIGAGACRPLSEWPGAPKKDSAARLAMFQRLAWANWRLDEIQNGQAFTSVLGIR